MGKYESSLKQLLKIMAIGYGIGFIVSLVVVFLMKDPLLESIAYILFFTTVVGSFATVIMSMKASTGLFALEMSRKAMISVIGTLATGASWGPIFFLIFIICVLVMLGIAIFVAVSFPLTFIYTLIMFIIEKCGARIPDLVSDILDKIVPIVSFCIAVVVVFRVFDILGSPTTSTSDSVTVASTQVETQQVETSKEEVSIVMPETEIVEIQSETVALINEPETVVEAQDQEYANGSYKIGVISITDKKILCDVYGDVTVDIPNMDAVQCGDKVIANSGAIYEIADVEGLYQFVALNIHDRLEKEGMNVKYALKDEYDWYYAIGQNTGNDYLVIDCVSDLNTCEQVVASKEYELSANADITLLSKKNWQEKKFTNDEFLNISPTYGENVEFTYQFMYADVVIKDNQIITFTEQYIP